MKLKNSCILLIAISLFLLVSIGSVCASENVTTDVTAQIDTEGTDVISVDNADTAISDGGDEGNGTEDTVEEKINTTVDAQDLEVKYNSSVEIPITVKDNESQEITVTQENITVTEGNKTVNFVYNNSIINITDKLDIGNHSLIINYLGNDLYKNSSKTILLSIFGDKTLTAPSLVTSDGITVEIPVIVSDGIREYIINENNVTLNLTYVDETGNASYMAIDSFTVENNAIRFLLNDLKFVSASVFVNYTESGKASKVGLKLATIVNAEDITLNEADDKNVTVTVMFGEIPLNITANDLKVLENNKELAFTYNNSIIKITSLSRGVHTLTIKYLSNETYAASEKNITASIWGNITINAVTSVTVNSTKRTEVVIYNITNGVDIYNYTLADLTVSASYKVGNDTLTANVTAIRIENKTLYLEFEDLNFTTATLTIKYNNTASTNVTVNRIYNARIEIVNNENEYKTGYFKFRLVDVDDNTTISGVKLSLYTTGNVRAGFSTTTDSEGIGQFKTANLYTFDNTNGTLSMQELKVGKYLVELSTEGSIKSTKVSTNLTVTKATISIAISSFSEEYQTNKNVTITVKNSQGEAMSGIVIHLYMPKTAGKDYYFMTGSDGTSKISVTNLIPGSYSMTVSNNDTKNINKKSATKSIYIKKMKVKIVAKNSNVKYNTGVSTIIKIVNAKTGKAVPNAIIKVTLYQTSKKFTTLRFQADSKGVVRFSASLAVGKHKMIVKMAEDKYEPRYTASQVTKYITVTRSNAKIVAPKVSAYYKQGKYFTVKLVNPYKNNQPIYDAKLDIKIYAGNKYYSYVGNTGGNGQIKLKITLAPGTYKVVIKGADSKNFVCKQITSQIKVFKAQTKITPTAATVKKGASEYFTAKVVNTKTKDVVSGVKLIAKVYTGKTYKTYSMTTNSKGIAKLPTKAFTVGLHKVVLTSANKYCIANAATSSIKVTK